MTTTQTPNTKYIAACRAEGFTSTTNLKYIEEIVFGTMLDGFCEETWTANGSVQDVYSAACADAIAIAAQIRPIL
jgi:hypothetical protein